MISIERNQRSERLGFEKLGFQKVHRCDSMQFDKKVHRYRFASNGIESHRIESRPMRFDAIRCESISMNFCIELHRVASMNFFENPVFQNPVFRTFDAARQCCFMIVPWIDASGATSNTESDIEIRSGTYCHSSSKA